MQYRFLYNRLILLGLAIVLTSVFAVAQSVPQLLPVKAISIRGQVVSAQGTGFVYVAIGLHTAKDSTLVKGTLTDSLGNFEFLNLKIGQYLVSGNATNGTKIYLKKFSLDSTTLITDLGKLTLADKTLQLAEVTITAKRPFIERRADRLIANISGSALAKGNNALEVLKIIPTLRVNGKEEISVMGKGGVLIIIDGKPQYNMGIQELKAMRGESIEKVEIYSNPPAKFDAQGAAVINIITQKSKMYSSFTETLAMPFYKTKNIIGTQFISNYSDLILYYQIKKWKIKTTLGWRQSKEDFQMGTSELLYKSNGVRRVGEYSQNNNNKSLRVGLGLDYDFDKNNSLTFDIRGSQAQQGSFYDQFNTYQYLSPLGKIDSTFITNSRTTYNTQSSNLYGGYIHKFKENKVLTLGVQRIKYSYPNPVSYQNTDRSNNTSSITNIDTYPNSGQTIQSYNLNVELPTSNKYFWEVGAKLTAVDYQNQFSWFDIKDNRATENLNYRNDFLYKENIWAGFASVKKTFNKVELSAGLRDEYTTSVGSNEGKDVIASYNNLFPSLFFQYTIAEEKQFGLSYTRRVQRPSYNEFNPKSLPFRDVLSLITGNAYLTPQFIHALEANLLVKDLYMAVSFNRTQKKRIGLPVGTEGKAIVNQIYNLDYLDNVTLSINKPFKMTSWWQSTNSFNYGFRRSKLLDSSVSSGYFWMLSSLQAFTLSSKSSIESFFSYSSAAVDQYTKDGIIKYVNISYKTTFLKNKIELITAVDDVLGINKWNYSLDTPIISSSGNITTNGRTIRVAVTYKFATTTKFNKKSQKTNNFGEIRN